MIHKKGNILNGEIYSNKEYIAISMPQLYKDIMYIKWEDINKLINNKENNDVSETIDSKTMRMFKHKKSKYYDKVNEDYKEFLIRLWMTMLQRRYCRHKYKR
ncbi:hypothetical protein JTT01_22305 [Clostridium botulinum]|nr:hypothetical protein [Clostridium botulinum]